ncbi:MAG: host attachment protein [Parcubacteria group bacterium]|nr:host attachment protein [Parcubacteria group bacterium]
MLKIPSKFPQFEGQNVLIVAAGSQDADIYIVSNGTLNKIVSFRIPRRKYSDEEGFSVQKSGVSGSAREYPKQAAIKEFLNRLEDELKIILKKEKISYVCLFSPDYMTKMVKAVFPAALRNKIKIFVSGNFSQHLPIELLAKINLKRKKLI